MQVGLDRLSELPALSARLRGARLGVLAHAASVDRRLRSILQVLDEIGARPTLLFGPEHGFAGGAQDMIAVGDARDPHSGARVVSLYGEEPSALVPTADDLSEVDLLLVDMSDVGSRYYTFVWTALLATRAAIAAGKHVVILDRPNPISGDPARIEGRTQDEGFISFVGLERVPIRHGLTLAEMVLGHLADDTPLGPDGAVSTVPVVGWSRDSSAPSWDRPFVLPSPNMPTFDTALVYPGGCLLEGTNLSEGRGHTRPFEICGAPWLDGWRLARDLHDTGLEGFVARPLTFVPTFHKHGGQPCGGVQVHVTEPLAFRPVATYAALVAAARMQRPDAFAFRTERYEFVDDIPAFDLLTGSSEAREAVEAGEAPRAVAELVSPASPGWPERMTRAEQGVTSARWA